MNFHVPASAEAPAIRPPEGPGVVILEERRSSRGNSRDQARTDVSTRANGGRRDCCGALVKGLCAEGPLTTQIGPVTDSGKRPSRRANADPAAKGP